MRRTPLGLVLLLLPALLRAQEVTDQPQLVFDTGGHTAPIRKVLFRPPDGKELLTVSQDKTVMVWDVETGTRLRVLRTPVGPGDQGELLAGAVSPDGKTLAVAGKGYDDGKGKRSCPVHLIDLDAGKVLRL